MKSVIHTVFITLCAIFAFPVYANPIIGEAGFELGQSFDPNVKGVERLQQDDVVYKTKPPSDTNDVAYVLLRITADQHIHRITVFYTPQSPAECDTRKNTMRKEIEKKYPDLGYYAMDDSELFYKEPRTLTIECVATEKKNSLKVEYSDDALAKK
ncbi:MAG: hypothetical protein PVG20_05185 [Thioalkalispiraceae bacterium]|jgi:hypothetical protein